MKNQIIKNRRRIRRKYHIRKNLNVTSERLRLSIYRSLGHIYAQIIDDMKGSTLVAASTLDKDVKGAIKPDTSKIEQSKLVGSVLAKRALEKNIKSIAFDRNGFLYHGRVKALAESARQGGLEF